MSRPSARILVVDDEEAQMKALCATLRDSGYETVGFFDSRAALAALRQARFDLLLSDLMMPEMDGITLLREAQETDPNLLGIIMTGQGTIATAVEAMKTGAFDYILKPFKLSVILPVLSRALAVRQLRLDNAALQEGLRQRTTELEAAQQQLMKTNAELERRVEERTAALRVQISARESAYRALARTEAKSKQAMARAEALLEAAPDPIVIVNRSGQIVLVNDESEKVFGYARSELLGEPVEKLMPEWFRQAHFETRQGYYEARRVLPMGAERELHARHKDGSEFPVDISLSSLETPEGVLVISNVRDITERKKAAAREAERLRQLKQLSELSMMLAGDPEVVFERVVRMIGELFGVRTVCLSEIVGKQLFFRTVYVGGTVTSDAGSCPLDITPCATVEETKDLRVYDRVMERFPDASFLRDHHAFAYCGFPALDSDGRVVAVTCLLDDKPREFTGEDQQLLLVIGQRIGAEIEHSKIMAERKRAEEALREYAGKLRRLSHRLFETEEIERRRLARELHDSIGQNLTVLNMTVGMIRAGLPADAREQVSAHLGDCEALLQTTGDLVRDVMADLRPPGLDELGLLAALTGYARQTGSRGRVPIAVSGAEIAPRLPPTAEIALFRIAQEAIVNALKHAGATHMVVTLESSPDAVIMSIADDGCGFDPAAQRFQAAAHLGLVNMRERAESIGGQLRVESAPGRGTRVIVEAPRSLPPNNG